MTATLTRHELACLRSQRLGRLATVDADGAPQNNPVGFVVDEATGDVLTGGRDLAAVDPWTPRGVELRGSAQALTGVDPPRRGMSRAVIRITPGWIASWGIEPGETGLKVRR